MVMEMQKIDPNARNPASYERWILDEGIPVFEDLVGVEDVAELPMEPWPRMGGRGTFIQLLSLYQAEKGMYVVEIPPGGSLNPERHLYEEFQFIFSGRGATEIWQEGRSKQTFEWGQGSAFAMPMNTWHRHMNASNEPVLILGLTTAPAIMNLLHETDFIFNCDHQFPSLYDGADDFFSRATSKIVGRSQATVWETNFIANAHTFALAGRADDSDGSKAVRYQMNRHWPNGHLIERAGGGHYGPAHRHPPGAILIGLDGHPAGFALVWPHTATSRPFENGNEDQVHRLAWGYRSVYTPANDWYHQHFSTSKEATRQIAVHSGTDRRPLINFGEFEEIMTSVYERDGGLQIAPGDEDPHIRELFEEDLARRGVKA